MRTPDLVITELPIATPCVYAWYRSGKCLYVGATTQALRTRLVSHHVVKFRKGDEIRIWEATKENLFMLEIQTIQELKPSRNVLHTGVPRTYKRRTFSYVSYH